MAYEPLDKDSSIDQAARFWGVDREVVWNWFRDELIGSFRDRGRLVLLKGSLPPPARPPLLARIAKFFHRTLREET